MATFGKNKKVVQKPWRPDLRNVEILPDTKVIRTGFLLNSLGILVALGCLGYYGYKEMDLQSLASEVNGLRLQVEDATPDDRQVLNINKDFVQRAGIVSEVVSFDTETVKFHDFLAEIGNAVQEASVLTDISMNHAPRASGNSELAPFTIKLTGKVFEEATSTPAQVLETFQKQILLLKSLDGKSPVIEMGLFSRNNELGHFDFTLSITIPVEKAPEL